MAGAGKKTFTAGEVLTASDVNGYLMEQSVMYFAGTAARSSAIPTPSTGMTTYIGVTGTATIPQLETYTGSAWQTPYGLTLVANASFTSSAAVSVNSVFTSKFANYRVMVTVNTSGSLRMRMRNAGTDATAGYGAVAPVYYSFSGFDGVGRISNGSYWDLWTLTSNVAISMDLHSPNLAERTSMLSQSVSDYGSANVYIGNGGAQINDSTQYDGFTIYPSTSTVSGNIRVYGYRNS